MLIFTLTGLPKLQFEIMVPWKSTGALLLSSTKPRFLSSISCTEHLFSTEFLSVVDTTSSLSRCSGDFGQVLTRHVNFKLDCFMGWNSNRRSSIICASSFSQTLSKKFKLFFLSVEKLLSVMYFLYIY